MATILDVAKLAGVSQGTVSNVLNGKGNVSSEKIRLVEEATRALGYTINEKAKILRQGSSNSLAVVLPNIQFKQYRDFYKSFKTCAEKYGYSTELLLTNDSPDEEIAVVQQAKAMMKKGIAIISCLNKEKGEKVFKEFPEKICYVERKTEFLAPYYGFDYVTCGRELAEELKNLPLKKVLLVRSTKKFSNAKEIVESFYSVLNEYGCEIVDISTDILGLPHTILEVFEDNIGIDAIVTTDFGYAEKINQMLEFFEQDLSIPIYTVSPIFSLPESGYTKYELNYSLLGKRVAEDLIHLKKNELKEKNIILENDGFRKWDSILIKKDKPDVLNMLVLEGPEATAIKGFARIYEKQTGIKINVSVFSFEEIYEAFVNADDFGFFDIFRIDVTWLSWFAEKILLPLETLDENISKLFQSYIPDISDKYAKFDGKVYALPVTPSVELLYYRKDLFEDVAIKRAYYEMHKTPLEVPKDFIEFNQIARFFTKSFNRESKVRYGTSLTLGNSGVATTEFLARFFSVKDHLYDENGKISIDNDAGVFAMKNLLEATKYIDMKKVSWWADAAKKFADGEVAMEIMFSNYASGILGYKSKIIDKIGYSIVPGGNPIIGGGSLAIAKNSKHPMDALDFIKWLSADPVATAMAALRGVSPCMKTYDIYEIVDVFPWMELSKECFSLSRTRRLPIDVNKPFDEKKFVRIIGGMIKNVCANVVKPENAIIILQKMIDEEFLL